MKDVMVDIETLGAGLNPVIVQIGACYFDRKTGYIGEKFKVNIDPVDAQRMGGILDADTVTWWLNQSREAQKSITADPKVSLVGALQAFQEFVKSADNIWSHATFDFVILNQVMRNVNVGKLPFRKARDIRTLVELSNMDPTGLSRAGTHHDALDDCKHQVKYCYYAFQELKNASG